MTATDNLRRILDERGVEYTQTIVTKDILFTIVTSKEHYFILMRDNDAGIEMWSQYFTPEQAVEAALGRGTCHMERDNAWSSDYDWHCTECGEHVSTCNKPPRFCPSCGRVVTDG